MARIGSGGPPPPSAACAVRHCAGTTSETSETSVTSVTSVTSAYGSGCIGGVFFEIGFWKKGERKRKNLYLMFPLFPR